MLSKAVVLNFSFSHQQHHSTSAPEPHRRAVWQRHLAGLTGLDRIGSAGSFSSMSVLRPWTRLPRTTTPSRA